jgi:hypothetical protein
MRYLVLATDYDNTLASEGRISGAARAALERLRASGRRAILVTGRRLDDLLRVCACGDLFDYGHNVLIAGGSGSGKSTLAAGSSSGSPNSITRYASSTRKGTMST